MLVLKIKPGESIHVGNDIIITYMRLTEMK